MVPNPVQTGTPPRRWASRILRLFVFVVVGGWGLYLVGMNAFVRTRLFRNLISEDPNAILVEYSSAYSVVPGHIHVNALRIRGRDSHVEWISLSINATSVSLSRI